MNKLRKQATAGSKTTENDIFENLNARFLHLAQNILCNREAAIKVAHKALDKVRNRYKELPPQKSFIQWTQKVLDNEIEYYFQELIKEIKADSAKSEIKLFNILDKRFMYLTNKKIFFDKENLSTEDAKDIIQNALFTVAEKCRTSKPKGTFIQWAQTILKYKYLEYRRDVKRRKPDKSLSEEEYERVYTETMSDVITKGRGEKEIKPEELESLKINIPDQSDMDPFLNDPNSFSPTIIPEYKDLKRHLLKIVKKMGERCKRVFKVLFSQGDRKFMYQEFPELTGPQIDVIVSRCRKQLKDKALKEGIL